MGAALTQLIPISELAPGAAGAIRNQVISALLALASKELTMPEEKLVVRDLRPVEDLALYSTGTTVSTINDWLFTTAATTVTGFVAINNVATAMADQRYVAIYGVKDLRMAYGTKQAAAATIVAGCQAVSLIKINVGGGDKAIWDLSKLQAYPEQIVGITPGGVIIPQNASYTISLYKSQGTASMVTAIVLEGVVVEPRGKTTSP